MASFTPIKVRGKKRHTSEAEKWHAGKKRKTYQENSVTPSEGSFSAQSSSSTSSTRKRRRRHEPELSRLEELPTEILQAIFEFSGNVDFPLVSPKLASQLSGGAGRHLHHQMTSQTLHPMLAGDGFVDEKKHAEYAAVARLTNSKFFTWQFFKDWLEEEFKRRNLLFDWQDALKRSPESWAPADWMDYTWIALSPSVNLMPPKKLLRGPFTNDKLHMLQFLTSQYRASPQSIYSTHPVTSEGLREAIAEGAVQILSCFFTLGARVDTEALQYAVIDAGCDKKIVHQLAAEALDNLISTDVDFLDPLLWAWADRAKEKGDAKVVWLTALLGCASRMHTRKKNEGLLDNDAILELPSPND